MCVLYVDRLSVEGLLPLNSKISTKNITESHMVNMHKVQYTVIHYMHEAPYVSSKGLYICNTVYILTVHY